MLIFSWSRKVITELKLLRYFVLGLFKLLRLKRILHFLHQYCSQHRTTHDQQYASGGKLNFNSIRPPESFTDSGLFQHEFFRSHKQLHDFSGPQKVRTLNFRAFFRPVASLFKCLLAILDIFAFVVTVIINFLFTISYGSWCRRHCSRSHCVLSKNCLLGVFPLSIQFAKPSAFDIILLVIVYVWFQRCII